MKSHLFFAYRRHARLRSLANFSRVRKASVCYIERKNAASLISRTPTRSRNHCVYGDPLKNFWIEIPSLRSYIVRRIASTAVSLKKSHVAIQHTEDNLENKESSHPSDERLGSGIEFRVRKYFIDTTKKIESTDRNRTRGIDLPRSPAAILALWLNLKSKSDRDTLLANYELLHRSNKTPLAKILLGHLHRTQDMVTDPHSAAHCFTTHELKTLSLSGYSAEDVHVWGSILSAASDEEVAQRYLACQTEKPLFLLREILRRPKLSARSFRALFMQLWEFLLKQPALHRLHRLPSPRDVESSVTNASCPPIPQNNIPLLEDNLFHTLVLLSLRHARQVLPPALVSITQMVIFYCERLAHNSHLENCDLEPRLHKRLSTIYNKAISCLTLPSSIHPMLSMTHNWHAQRLLLESAGTFKPPLQLNKNSYRAVSQVLAASKKSPREARYSGLIQRPWPPWRKEQDGMDMDRSPDEDVSRVAATISQMSESGYGEDTLDRAIKILGGREPDGTPTIQMRRLIKVRVTHRNGERDATRDRDSRIEWAARIDATRDVREAWEAFQVFTSSDRRPSIVMYHAMFRKLIFDAMRSGGQNSDALPGDGLEVLATLEDNLTKSEMVRLRPPSIDDLFTRMLDDGCRPSGRLLDLLIRHATSFPQVITFIKNSTLQKTVARDLFVLPELTSRLKLQKVPDRTLAAFIKFLAWPNRGQIILEPHLPAAGESQRWDAQNCVKFSSLQHAYDLVKCRQSSSSIMWNELFKGLARPRAKLDLEADQHMNNILTWRLLITSLDDSQQAGAQLDPTGFQYLCVGLQKAQVSSRLITEDISGLIQRGLGILKGAFSTLTETAEAVYGLPRLLYAINGAQLHAYVRVMGLAHDSDEVLSTLRWMVQHQHELTNMAEQARNGRKLLRRTLIATRAVFDTGDLADGVVIASLRQTMEQLDGWGGWPTDEEANDYLARWEMWKSEADEWGLEASINSQ